jgi:hypothetical protein
MCWKVPATSGIPTLANELWTIRRHEKFSCKFNELRDFLALRR